MIPTPEHFLKKRAWPRGAGALQLQVMGLRAPLVAIGVFLQILGKFLQELLL